MRSTALLGLLGVSACGPQATEATWVTGFGFTWGFANHRISQLDVPPEEGEVSVVGGASTTGITYDDEGTCLDASTCWELPVVDDATTFVERTGVRSSKAFLAPFTAELVVNAQGADAVVEVDVPRAIGEATAWISGFSLDTNTPHGASSCYDPRHGWLPTRLAIDVQAGSLQSRKVPVTVSAVFASGLSMEAQRACLDAAAPSAAVRLVVHGVLAVGASEPWVITTTRGATWPWSGEGDPPSQQLADVGDVTVELPTENPWLAWASIDYRFHETLDPGRGAYLRDLELVADATTAEVYGFATNTSPALTLQSGFEYRFEGKTFVWDQVAF